MTLEDKKKLWWFLMDVKESTIYETNDYISIIENDVGKKESIKWNIEWREINFP